MRITPVALVACFATQVLAQQAWIVGPGGFAALDLAVAAAAPGDTIVVRAGQYPPATIDKGVRVLGDPGARVQASVGVSLTIANVPAGQTAVVRGLRTDITHAGVQVDYLVTDCDGHVLVQDIDLLYAIAVVRSPHVSLQRVVNSSVGWVEALDSTVALAGCAFFGPPGGSALRCTNSDVVATDCTWRGGPQLLFPARPAIELASGSLVLTGADSDVRAGTGAVVAAIETGGGALAIDPRVPLVPSGGALPITGPATVRFASLPSMRTEVASGRLDVVVDPAGGTRVHVVASPPVAPLPTPFGALWVGFQHFVLASGVTPDPVTGLASLSFPVTGMPPGTPLALQAVVETTAAPAGFVLSAPGETTLD